MNNGGGAFFASRMPATLKRELDGCQGCLEAEAATWVLWRLREKLPAMDWGELMEAMAQIEALTFQRRQAIEAVEERRAGAAVTLQEVAAATERRAV